MRVDTVSKPTSIASYGHAQQHSGFISFVEASCGDDELFKSLKYRLPHFAPVRVFRDLLSFCYPNATEVDIENALHITQSLDLYARVIDDAEDTAFFTVVHANQIHAASLVLISCLRLASEAGASSHFTETVRLLLRDASSSNRALMNTYRASRGLEERYPIEFVLKELPLKGIYALAGFYYLADVLGISVSTERRIATHALAKHFLKTIFLVDDLVDLQEDYEQRFSTLAVTTVLGGTGHERRPLPFDQAFIRGGLPAYLDIMLTETRYLEATCRRVGFVGMVGGLREHIKHLEKFRGADSDVDTYRRLLEGIWPVLAYGP